MLSSFLDEDKVLNLRENWVFNVLYVVTYLTNINQIDYN